MPDLNIPPVNDKATTTQKTTTTTATTPMQKAVDSNEDSELEFQLSFELDGVTKYEDLSETLPEYSTLQVFIDPIVQRFDNEVKEFQPVWPFKEMFLSIRVRLHYIHYTFKHFNYV